MKRPAAVLRLLPLAVAGLAAYPQAHPQTSAHAESPDAASAKADAPLAPAAAAACAAPPPPRRAKAQATASVQADAQAKAAADAQAEPVLLQAREVRGRPDVDASAEGEVRLQRGPLVLQADRLDYAQAQDLARASGQVRIEHPSGHYSGSELQLQLDRFEGFFLQPSYEFERVQAGGRAKRIDFLDRDRSVIEGGWYTSCPREDVVSPTGEGGTPRPDWVLQSDRVRLDFEANEGIAEGAVLRFMNVPILALPTMSFPLGEARKSGWLPPTLDLDTRSGLSVAVPYYWNLAPNRDATLTPRLITRRGAGANAEFRYLEPAASGRIEGELLPEDRLAGRTRWLLATEHEGRLPGPLRWQLQALRVSDDAWWKDFPLDARSLTPRLLPQRLAAERDLDFGWGQGLAYARMLRWQVLQGSDQRLVPPYERAPQIGLQLDGPLAGGLRYALQAETTRFVPLQGTLGAGGAAGVPPAGWRSHVLADVSRHLGDEGAWWTPRLALNAASYALEQPLADGRRRAGRVIPTFSVEGGLTFERDTALFGRALRQTLEPRALYVNTPWREQGGLPNFDSAARDINFDAIFSDNAFTGVDRVSDAHQVTLGVTTRLLDAASGAEAARLALAQRYLLRDQRITPEGTPLTRRASDLFALGGATLARGLAVDLALQYSPQLQRTVRSVGSLRWNPGDFRTVSATYRLTRGLAEQVELGWQWPVWKTAAGRAAASPVSGAAGGQACGGNLYTVGRVNYSLRDSRVTDSILGLEYDAGCWILRLVGERLSTGRSEATTHILLQLELVGLSRLGSNPLRVLKDNIPGYRLLRDERAQPTPAPPRYD
jgi:LPS-assembly protein